MEKTFSELRQAIQSSRMACIGSGLKRHLPYSLMINSAFFPPQVHDRKIQTHNLPKLIALSILALMRLAQDGGEHLMFSQDSSGFRLLRYRFYACGGPAAVLGVISLTFLAL